MKEILVPEDGALQEKKKASLSRARKAAAIGSFVVGILAVLSLIGALVCLILTEVTEQSKSGETLLYILSGALAGGALLFAVFAVLLSKLTQSAYQTEQDFRERCDSEHSFFVGEGTLATFEKDVLRIHAEEGGAKEIKVPYSEIRLFSICTRHVPREKGEWSIAIEVPAKYLAKAGQPVEERPALIQADAKERLYRRLDELNLSVLGERERQEKDKKFTLQKKFSFPNREGRKRALMQIVMGAVLLGAGVGLAFWQLMLGCIVGVFGAFFLGRAVLSFLKKRNELAFYDEGIYWKEETRNESVFLKWEEVEGISEEEYQGLRLMKVACSYGAFHFFTCDGAMEYLQQTHPEKCVE